MSVCRLVRPSPLKVFLYNSYTIGRIGTKIDIRVDNNDGKKFLKDQGHWVKGPGQIDDFVENVFGL